MTCHGSHLCLLAIIVVAALPAAASAKPASLFGLSGLGPREAILVPSLGGGVDVEETLHYDGDNDDATGLTSGGTFTGAVRFTATDNCQLVALLFFQYQGSADDCAFAWGEGMTTTPGPILDSAAYTGAGDSVWKRVDFSAPISINSGDDFWVGPRITHAAGVYPLGVDAGPMVPDRGGFVCLEGAWSQLYDYGLDYNWNIRAIVTTVMLDHDVGVVSVGPSGAIMVGIPVTFAGTVRNFGANTETFDVHYEVLDSVLGVNLFEGDTTMTGLATGAAADLAFGTSTPASGDVVITTVSTLLAGDQNPTNDVRVARARCCLVNRYDYLSTQEGDPVPYGWIDPTAGTPITTWTGSSDDGFATCALPFTLNYYDTLLTDINICTNGFLSTVWATTYTNTALPQATIPNLIALYWDDLNPGAGGTVYQYNSPANDYTVFAWINVPPYSGTGFLTAEAILDNRGFGGSGRVQCNYLAVPDVASSSTTGIQGGTGANNEYLQYCYNGSPGFHVPAPGVGVLYFVPPYAVADPDARTAAQPLLRLPTPCVSDWVALPPALGKGTALVVGLDGRVLRSVALTGSGAQVSLAGLSPGVYFLCLATTETRQTHKLILAR